MSPNNFAERDFSIHIQVQMLCQRRDDDGRASGRVVAGLPSATPQEATTLAETTTPAHQLLMVTRSRLRRANASIHANP
jgi:hypothetical protein